MSKVLIALPEDLEQVLQSMIERDPDKGTELLKAGFKARLERFPTGCMGSVSVFLDGQALRIHMCHTSE